MAAAERSTATVPQLDHGKPSQWSSSDAGSPTWNVRAASHFGGADIIFPSSERRGERLRILTHFLFTFMIISISFTSSTGQENVSTQVPPDSSKSEEIGR